MDRVTKSLLGTYVAAAGLDSLSESQQFERFVTHIALSKIYGGNFSADDFCVGDGVQGLDAAALLVNGALVEDVSDLKEILSEAGQIRVDVVLVQAKTSPKFELGDLGIFADAAVSLIVDEDSTVLPDFSRMLNLLWENSDRFIENPVVRLYYVTTGKWEAPSPLNRKIEQTKKKLIDSNLISRVDFHPWGAGEVQNGWRAIDRGLKTTITFENRTTLPEMPGIEQAFLGIVRADQLLKLITDDEGGDPQGVVLRQRARFSRRRRCKRRHPTDPAFSR